MHRAEPLGARSARVVAQAKVNLFLRVLAREASGYHQIETLFQRLELGDEVRVRVGPGAARTLDCRGADTGPAERNLAWRAALAYADRAGWPPAFALEIEKRVPVGGGLGGGSADAGAVLRCLNALAPTPLPTAELLRLAAPLGSDVPFLSTAAPLALAWGRGERMLSLPPLHARLVRLALFDAGVSTADAYGWLAAARGASPSVEPRLVSLGEVSSWDGVAALARNDFEAVVLPRHHAAAVALAKLRERGGAGRPGAAAPRIAMLAGSGATVFAIDDASAAAADDAALAAGSGARVVVTRTASAVAPVELID